jgi:signal transduction histidine kinase
MVSVPCTDLRSADGDRASSGPAAGIAERASGHFVQFYDADDVLTDAVSEFALGALGAGNAAVVVATAAHREDIARRIEATGVSLGTARACGRYLDVDAVETLSSFMENGDPVANRFRAVIWHLLGQAARGGRQVRIFGEMVAVLASDANHSGALRLERLWNESLKQKSFTLFCAYPMASVNGADCSEMLGEVCAEHTRVIPAESYTSLPTTNDRLRAVVRWEQKARSLEAALAAERASRPEAEAALRVRDQFLSTASHELRTPLTTLSGHAQMMLRQIRRTGTLDPERAVRAAEVIKQQSDRLSFLIGQFLDISRIRAGKLSVRPIPTDLVALVREASSSITMQPGAIHVSAPPSLQATVDPVRIEQVLINLLDNAVRYSPEGSPIEVVVCGDESGMAEIAVRDHGPGIAIENRDRLFEPFSDGHATAHEGGMGLGLYVSRQIVEMHGGSIHADFPPDSGARFVVRLRSENDDGHAASP